MQQTSLDADFDMIDWLYGGLESVLCDRPNFHAMTGNESYYCYHHDVWAGMEAETSTTTTTTKSSSASSSSSKSSSASASSDNTKAAAPKAGDNKSYIDSVKKVAQNLYKNLMDMLKRVREYFFGEGEQAAVDAAKNATDAVNAMADLNSAAPIPDDAAARDPSTYLKALEGGTEYNELLNEYPDLKNAIERVKASASKISNSDTVGKLRASYADLVKNANNGIQAVTGALRRVMADAEKKTGELKNPKVPGTGDTTEVKAGIKEQNQQTIAEAKEGTKKARLVGGVRNKLVAALSAISAQSKTIKDKPPQSKFKG